MLDLLRPDFVGRLAAEFGDCGAITNFNMEGDPTDPENLLLSYEKKIDALERLN